MKTVFITGGTGYIGKRLIKQLLIRKFRVVALVRKGSELKVPAGTQFVIADAFNAASFQHHIPSNCVFVQLLGVPHPNPKKAALFDQIDLNSLRQSVIAAKYAGVTHFIYVSVSMEPSSIMYAYQQIRKKGEEICKTAGLNCTFIRPWYVLGPGHLWPILFLPLYLIASLIPSLRHKAKKFGLVTIAQMIRVLVKAVEAKPQPLKIVDISEIKSEPPLP